MVGAAGVGAVTGRVVGRVPAGDGVDLAGRAVVPRVPDWSVRSSISGRSRVAGCTRSPKTTVCWPRRRLPAGPRADQAVEEVGARLGVGGRADAEEAVAVLDVGAKRVLLRSLGKDVPVGVEEGDGGVLLEVRGGEVGRVVGDRDAEAVLRAEVLDRDDAGVRGGVGAVVEDEDLGGGLGGGGAGGREHRQRYERAGRKQGGGRSAQVSGGGSFGLGPLVTRALLRARLSQPRP